MSANAAACAAAEGQAVAGALPERVVDVALARSDAPVIVGKTVPVLKREVFDAAREEISLESRVGCVRELAVGDEAGKRRLFEDVELIAVDAVERKRGRRSEVVLPHLHGLAGEAVDEVDHNGCIVITAQALEPRNDGVASVHTAHGLANGRAEGLHAEGEAVDAAFERSFDLVVAEIVNAAFKRDLAVVRERKMLLDGAEHELEVFGRKGRRGAPAEVDGVNGRGILSRTTGPHADFLDKPLGIGAHRLFAERVLVEHAVETARFAEGHVDVSERLPRTRTVIERLERLAGVFAEFGHAARTRVDGRLGGKACMKRVLGIGKEGFGRTGVYGVRHRACAGFEGGGRMLRTRSAGVGMRVHGSGCLLCPKACEKFV